MMLPLLPISVLFKRHVREGEEMLVKVGLIRKITWEKMTLGTRLSRFRERGGGKARGHDVIIFIHNGWRTGKFDKTFAIIVHIG